MSQNAFQCVRTWLRLYTNDGNGAVEWRIRITVGDMANVSKGQRSGNAQQLVLGLSDEDDCVSVFWKCRCETGREASCVSNLCVSDPVGKWKNDEVVIKDVGAIVNS